MRENRKNISSVTQEPPWIRLFGESLSLILISSCRDNPLRDSFSPILLLQVKRDHWEIWQYMSNLEIVIYTEQTKGVRIAYLRWCRNIRWQFGNGRLLYSRLVMSKSCDNTIIVKIIASSARRHGFRKITHRFPDWHSNVAGQSRA